MALVPWKFGRKCCFCGEKENLSFAPAYGIYGEQLKRKYAFHYGCLENVLEEPEKYGHRKADLALVIINCMKKKENRDKNYYTKYKEKQNKLRNEFEKIPWWTLEKFKKVEK